MMQQIQIDFASQARDKGMKKALDHAEMLSPGWSQVALEAVKEYATENRHKLFQAEDVRSSKVVPPPPHLRAWGPIMKAAIIRGYILPVGQQQVKNVKAHRAFARLYKSNID